MQVVVDLDRRIDTRAQADLAGAAIGETDRHLDVLLRLQLGRHVDVEGLVAAHAQGLPGIRALELQRQHAHAHEVGAVDALEAAGDHGLHAQQLRTLGRPVARGAGPVLLTAHDDRGCSGGDVLHRGVVDRHLLAARLEEGQAAFLPRAIGLRGQHQVLDAHVGEGATHHDLVIAAARPVAVEVCLLHAVGEQVLTCGRAFLDRARRRDVIGGDGVAEESERPSPSHRMVARMNRLAEVLEERRLCDVSRSRPVVDLAAHALDLFPERARVAADLAVVLLEHARVHRVLQQSGDLLRTGPDVPQPDVLASLALADRLGHQVDHHVAGERVRDHQRRRREEVGLEVRVDAGLEVPVARQHRRTHEVVGRDQLVEFRREVTGVADAGRAAVGGDVEAELLEVGQQSGARQVVCHYARAGRQGGLDVGFHLHSGFDRLLGQQTGGQQHAGVRGVGAGGDRRDQHVAVADRQARRGGECLLELVGRLVEAVVGRAGGEQAAELGFHASDLDAVLGAFRTRERRLHGVEIQGDDACVVDLAGHRHAEETLLAEIRFEGVDLGGRAPGAAEVFDRLLVHGEEAHGRAVFGRHVADGRAVGQAEAGRAGAEELHELAHHLLATQHLGDGQHEVGGGHAFAQAALELHADHIGGEEVNRLAEHARLRLDATDAPADHADTVDHGGMAVGTHQGVGVQHAVAALVYATREVFEVHLVDDAEPRRYDAEGIECLHAPFHELVALPVALELEFHVEVECLLGAEVVDHHRVVDDQVHRHQRLDASRVLAGALGGTAHRGEVGEQRYAGEVLQHHAGDDERDLIRAFAGGGPVGQLAHVFLGDLLAVAVAQYRLEHDADRHRQARYRREPLRQRRQRMQLRGFAGRGGEALQGLERIVRHGGLGQRFAMGGVQGLRSRRGSRNGASAVVRRGCNRWRVAARCAR